MKYPLPEIRLKDGKKVMKFFKKVEDKTFAFVLFYILKQIPYTSEQYDSDEKEFGSKVKKLIACGEKEIDLKSEQDLLLKYKSLQIYTDEEMFGLFAPNQKLYLYTNPIEGKDVEIHDIGIVGNCTYISDSEICSTVRFTENMSTNDFFKRFKEFVQKNHTEVADFVFHFENDIFTITYEDKLILEATDINVSVAHSFVLYTLQHLEPLWIAKKRAKGEECKGFNETFKIERIEKIQRK